MSIESYIKVYFIVNLKSFNFCFNNQSSCEGRNVSLLILESSMNSKSLFFLEL